jgi:glucose-1-phosphate adenylyltransferase
MSKFGTCIVDDTMRITGFEEKPEKPKSDLASMGIYVFKPRVLYDCLLGETGRGTPYHDFGGEIVPALIISREVYAYRFRGYWQDVGTIKSYFESNMAFLNPQSPIDLDDPDWPILTKFWDLPPIRFLGESSVSDCLVSDGTVLGGSVENSVVSPGVVIEPGAVVRNSIVMSGCRVSAGATVNLSILDKDTTVGEGARVGCGVDFSPNREHPVIMRQGVTLVGKGSTIPAGSTVGRNCLVRSPGHSQPFHLGSGETLTE